MRSFVSSARFAALPVVQSIAVVTLLFGGAWTWLAGGSLLIAILLLDEAVGDYRRPVANPNETYLQGVIYATVPLTVLMTLGLLLHSASSGTPAGTAASAIGLADGQNEPWIAITGAIFTVGVVFGATSSFAHELFHRTKRLDWACAQVVLAQCLYTPFATEHLYGHHRDVGLPNDTATAPRGMTLWHYLPRAVVGAYSGAARIEARRLKRRQLPWFSWRNRFLQGQALQLVILGVIFAGSGIGGLAGFAAAVATAILCIEMANYVGHYGVVRVAGRPVRPRHSWNCPRLGSTSFLINLQRHSDHHRSASRPYWTLTVLDQAPIYPFGMYLMALIALIPPLWFRVTDPLLEDWDQRLASPGELQLLGNQTPTKLDGLLPGRSGRCVG